MDVPPSQSFGWIPKIWKPSKRFEKAQRNGKMLEIMLPAGIMTTIFLGNTPAQVAYNIQSTDWLQFAAAMTRISPLVRQRIVTIAQMQRLRAGLSYEQTQFWRAVESGCQP